MQEVNKGCDALLAQLESARYIVGATAAAEDARAAKLGLDAAAAAKPAASSPRRTPSQGGTNIDSDAEGKEVKEAKEAPQAPERAPEKVRRREKAEALLAELHEAVSVAKAQLAGSIQSLSALVNKVRTSPGTAMCMLLPRLVQCKQESAQHLLWQCWEDQRNLVGHGQRREHVHIAVEKHHQLIGTQRLQDGDIELHPVLGDSRLQGTATAPPAYQRQLSLHASLVGLRCRYCALLLRWVNEIASLNRMLAGREVKSEGKASVATVRCLELLLVATYADHIN
jgi:hypothetical protein